MNKEDFKILECTVEHIKTNREPQNESELAMMNNAVYDQMIRQELQNPSPYIQFKE